MYVIRVTSLEISPIGSGRALKLGVPLVVCDETHQQSPGLDIFTDGVVWEDQRYLLSFEVTTKMPVWSASLTVNDHNPLWLVEASSSEMWLGSERIFSYRFELDQSGQELEYMFPFSLTCGFARVEVSVKFGDGSICELVSQDIVSLDEPRVAGQTGESAEEANVRDMLKMLLKADKNQAAEWMFSTERHAPSGGALSSDSNTDWAYGGIASRIQLASDALDFVYDGIEDPFDAFPNVLSPQDTSGAGLHDTRENQLTRALLCSMAEHGERIVSILEDMLGDTQRTSHTLDQLIAKGKTIRDHTAPMPALAILEVRERRESELLADARDIAERLDDVMRILDDPAEGMGQVSKIEFYVPDHEGLFVSDHTYASIYSAMCVWQRVADVPLERTDLSLHVMKPDRLFEYVALHRMLTWLHRHGFHENEGYAHPIDRYRYSLENEYAKYENEQRCANTYHLVRDESLNHHKVAYVDLFYQPVIYADEREENGISLHRVPKRNENTMEGDFWTPDYLLAVGDGERNRTYLIDAKYCRAGILRTKLNDCVNKYHGQTSNTRAGEPGEGVDGVILLAGKLDAEQYSSKRFGEGSGRHLRAIAPFHSRRGLSKLGRLFADIGIEP